MPNPEQPSEPKGEVPPTEPTADERNPFALKGLAEAVAADKRLSLPKSKVKEYKPRAKGRPDEEQEGQNDSL